MIASTMAMQHIEKSSVVTCAHVADEGILKIAVNGDRSTNNNINIATDEDVQRTGETATTLGGVVWRHDTAQMRAH